MTIQNTKREGPIPTVNDVFAWMGAHIRIQRIGKTKTWADVKVWSCNGQAWSRRLILPLPAEARPCAHPNDENCDCARIPDTGFPEET